MFCLFKKTLGVCLIGLLLPLTGWLFAIGIAVCLIGLVWLAC